MSASRPLVCAAIFLGVALGACARATEVELRLYPCMAVEMGSPNRVDLEIVGYDAAGEAMAPLVHGFDIPDPGVFADGYATVGLNKPAGMVEAAFTLTWSYGSGVMATAELPRRPVPSAGAVLELGDDGCMVVGDTTGTSTGDSSTSSGSTSAGETSSTGSTSTSTSETSTSTGETSTSSGSESSTGASSTTGEMTMVGQLCDSEGDLFCENSDAGKLGNALYCQGGVWVVADLVKACTPLESFCPVDLLMGAVPIGCTNKGIDSFGCACRDEPAVPCDQLDVGCDGNDHITLCTNEGQGDIRVKGLCVGLCKDDGQGQGPYCQP